MPRTKTFALLAALGAAFIAVVWVSPALAGSKAGAGAIWDPVSHAPTTGDVIHIYSFRRLKQLTGGYNSATGNYAGSGALESPCGPAGARHWCATRVNYKLMNSAPRGTCGYVWANLYVRPAGDTRWRELSHYHDTVLEDCQ